MDSSCILVENNVVPESLRKEIFDWVVSNDNLDIFNASTINSSTDREAFAVTYTKDNLPTILSYFSAPKTNIYNFIAIVTRISGDIPTHTDDDLTCVMNGMDINPIYVKLPHTTSVHYIDICDQMTGGDTIFECIDKEVIIPAKQNNMVTFPSSIPHAVTAINSSTKPRVVIVCEKYYMLPSGYKKIVTGRYRSG